MVSDYSNFIVNIKRELRRLRKEENLSQNDLARKMKVAQSVISVYETDYKRNPTLFSMLDYANAIGYKTEIRFVKK